MVKKAISILLIVVFVGIFFSGCVTRPVYSDYIGYEKTEALDDLQSVKTGNTIKLVLNWLLWGGLGLWIPSIVDTIYYIDYSKDFNKIERKIEIIPDGEKVR